MPELARFYGIVISMFTIDHPPPHMHVYGGNRKHPDWVASVDFEGRVIAGHMPGAARRLLRQWIRLHQDELRRAWADLRAGHNPQKISPLR